MYFNFRICICEYAHRCLMRALDPLEVEGGGGCEQSDMCSGDPIQVLYKQQWTLLTAGPPPQPHCGHPAGCEERDLCGLGFQISNGWWFRASTLACWLFVCLLWMDSAPVLCPLSVGVLLSGGMSLDGVSAGSFGCSATPSSFTGLQHCSVPVSAALICGSQLLGPMLWE